MKTKQTLVLGLPLIASCLFLAVRRGYSEPVDNGIERIAELEIELVCCLSNGSSRTDSAFRDLSRCCFISGASAASPFQEIQRADTLNGEESVLVFAEDSVAG
jgi:hypothetical protein